MGGEHSHVVTGVVKAGSYVVAVLCFRLRLVVSRYSADVWLKERPHLPVGGEANRTTSRTRICLQYVRCGCGAVQDVARSGRRFCPQGRVDRCVRVQYWHFDTRGDGSVIDHYQCLFDYTVVRGAVCWRQHAHFIPIVRVGKRGKYQLVHGDLPRQDSFRTILRFTGPVPADSR